MQLHETCSMMDIDVLITCVYVLLSPSTSDPWVQPSSHVPASAKPPTLSPRLPDYECILSRSTRERDVRRQEAEALYGYFKTEHALEHDKSQRGTVGRSTDPSTRPIPAQLRCRTPTCSRQRKPIPSGGGYYDYCSKECRDNSKGAWAHCVYFVKISV